MCNSGKFVNEIDRLELRFMDEFLAIEKNFHPRLELKILYFTKIPKKSNIKKHIFAK